MKYSNGHHPLNFDQVVAGRFAKSVAVSDAFFAAENEAIARACWDMARRFHQGGRLIAFGNGPAASDAQHISVEFVHPVIMGKRALPAIALTNDSALLSERGSTHPGAPFSPQLAALGRPQDMAVGFVAAGRDQNVLATLQAAKERGMLTLGMSGGSAVSFAPPYLDYWFNVPDDDAFVVQETHETLYHVLWELVHVFFEHEGLLV